MLLTLHSYILRELLKNFLLSVLTLTTVFTLGGGLYNSIRHEGVGPADLFNVLPMLLPIAVTYTMPISALFAVTMLYGRLAADNEFVACRAAGINIHWLFTPAILLAVVVTVVSLFSMNVLIPSAMREIKFYAKRNLRDIAFHKLRQAGYVDYNHVGSGNRYVLTAQSVRDVRDGALVEKGFPPPNNFVRYFWVDSPCFLWIDPDERLRRWAVAEGGLCQFDTRDDEVKLTLYVRNARDFEAGRSATLIRSQKIGPIPAPFPFPVKPNMVGLNTLLRWREAPWEAPELADDIESLQVGMRVFDIFTEMGTRLEAGQPILLTDLDNNRYTIRSPKVRAADRSLRIFEVELERTVPDQTRPIRILAPRGQIRVGLNPDGLLSAAVELESEGETSVAEYNPRAADYNKPIPKDAYATPELLLPAELVDGIPAPTRANVIDDTHPLGNEMLDAQREKLQFGLQRLKRKVMGEFHGRLSFALSNLVTILMGAILGVVFRGSRALAAFGLACIPFGVAAMLILIGKQQIESSDSTLVGATVVWGGLTLVAVLDVIFMRLGVRR